jgi:hypothetical protein
MAELDDDDDVAEGMSCSGPPTDPAPTDPASEALCFLFAVLETAPSSDALLAATEGLDTGTIADDDNDDDAGVTDDDDGNDEDGLSSVLIEVSSAAV